MRNCNIFDDMVFFKAVVEDIGRKVRKYALTQ